MNAALAKSCRRRPAPPPTTAARRPTRRRPRRSRRCRTGAALLKVLQMPMPDGGLTPTQPALTEPSTRPARGPRCTRIIRWPSCWPYGWFADAESRRQLLRGRDPGVQHRRYQRGDQRGAFWVFTGMPAIKTLRDCRALQMWTRARRIFWTRSRRAVEPPRRSSSTRRATQIVPLGARFDPAGRAFATCWYRLPKRVRRSTSTK